MKKILFGLFLVIITFSTSNVEAALSANGIKITETSGESAYNLYCEYGDGTYVLFNSNAINENFNMEVKDGVYYDLSTTCSNKFDIACLTKTGFVVNNKLDCPKYVYGTMTNSTISNIAGFANSADSIDAKYGYVINSTSTSSLECDADVCNAVSNQQTTDELSKFSCTYTGQKTGKTLTLYNSGDGNGDYVTYPDGTTEKLTSVPLTGGEECGDVFYIESTKTLKGAGNIETNFGENYTYLRDLDGLCGNYEFSQIEQYCSGTCKQKVAAACPVTSMACGELDDIPLALPKFIRNLIELIKIAVPIILIIMGMLDFGRGMAAKDDKAASEAKTRFIRRVIASVVVFLAVTIVQLALRMLGGIDNDTLDCLNCFLNDDCSTQLAVEVKGTE